MKTARLKPHDKDIERAVIGSMLIDNRALMLGVSMIKTIDIFYLPENKTIADAIIYLENEHQPVDILTVTNRLREVNKLEAIGGSYAIVEYSTEVATGANIERYILMLNQFFIKRKLIDIGNSIINRAYDNAIDALKLLETANKILNNIELQIVNGSEPKTISVQMDRLTERLKIIDKMEEGELIGITTGFDAIDKLTGGYQDGHLIIVAARPGMGKTSYMLKIASSAAISGKKVGIFSIEMPAMELAARISSINSHFHLKQIIQTGFEKDEYWLKWYELTEKMKKLPIIIDDDSTITIQELRRRAIIMQRKYGLDILFVDYIQLMSGNDNKKNREQEIATISRGLKIIAKELNIPVIALSQLSRRVEERKDKRPKLADLRESGAIEQDADMVQMIYRPEEYNMPMDDELLHSYPGANTELIINKNRHGSKGRVGLFFDKNKTKFINANEVLKNNDMPF